MPGMRILTCHTGNVDSSSVAASVDRAIQPFHGHALGDTSWSLIRSPTSLGQDDKQSAALGCTADAAACRSTSTGSMTKSSQHKHLAAPKLTCFRASQSLVGLLAMAPSTGGGDVSPLQFLFCMAPYVPSTCALHVAALPPHVGALTAWSCHAGTVQQLCHHVCPLRRCTGRGTRAGRRGCISAAGLPVHLLPAAVPLLQPTGRRRQLRSATRLRGPGATSALTYINPGSMRPIEQSFCLLASDPRAPRQHLLIVNVLPTANKDHELLRAACCTERMAWNSPMTLGFVELITMPGHIDTRNSTRRHD